MGGQHKLSSRLSAHHNGLFAHSFPCGHTASCPGIHCHFMHQWLTDMSLIPSKLIQESYNPTSSHHLSPDEHRRLQSELYELQRRWEAWGLVVPFLFDQTDPNVQFFGAHTAQVKISRDWYAPDTQSIHPYPHSLCLSQGEFPNRS